MSQTTRDDEVIDDEDVDDIVEIASELQQQESEDAARLDRDDMIQIGTELGLDEEHVDEAIEVHQDREEAAEEKARTHAKIAIVAGVAVAFLAILVLILAFVGRGSVKEERSKVNKAKAQVRNVLDRQANVEKRFEGAELNSDREAELAGAENRVAIEKRRYDEAATEYNDVAGSFPGSWGATVFGLPKSVPLSNKVDEW
jgi:uncharacterized protein HemX